MSTRDLVPCDLGASFARRNIHTGRIVEQNAEPQCFCPFIVADKGDRNVIGTGFFAPGIPGRFEIRFIGKLFPGAVKNDDVRGLFGPVAVILRFGKRDA